VCDGVGGWVGGWVGVFTSSESRSSNTRMHKEW
jgi:hypothetical protein